MMISFSSFRDLIDESEGFREAITFRLLPYLFVNDIFMPPDDPLGRSGQKLDQFLKIFP
jgi:ribonuclease ZC3H12